MTRTEDFEPAHAASSTAHVLAVLQMYGYHPFEDEPDPESRRIGGAGADIFDAIAATLTDTRLEPDLEALLWSTVNIFHRMVGQVERELDRNEQAQKRGQQEQDGSEICSVGWMTGFRCWVEMEHVGHSDEWKPHRTTLSQLHANAPYPASALLMSNFFVGATEKPSRSSVQSVRGSCCCYVL